MPSEKSHSALTRVTDMLHYQNETDNYLGDLEQHHFPWPTRTSFVVRDEPCVFRVEVRVRGRRKMKRGKLIVRLGPSFASFRAINSSTRLHLLLVKTASQSQGDFVHSLHTYQQTNRLYTYTQWLVTLKVADKRACCLVQASVLFPQTSSHRGWAPWPSCRNKTPDLDSELDLCFRLLGWSIPTSWSCGPGALTGP